MTLPLLPQSNPVERMARQMRLAADVAVRSQCAPATAAPTGCVLLDRNGHWLAASETSQAGTHPELTALRRANHAGPHTDGGAAVVTMEPCGDCAVALLRAGIRTVVYGVTNPRGGAAAVLLAGGARVVPKVGEELVASGALRPWLHHQHTGQPYVTWIHAASPWGRLSTVDDAGPEVGADVAWLRHTSDVHLTGGGDLTAIQQEHPAVTHLLVQDAPGGLLGSVNRVVQYIGPEITGTARAPDIDRIRLVSSARLGCAVIRLAWEVEQ